MIREVPEGSHWSIFRLTLEPYLPGNNPIDMYREDV